MLVLIGESASGKSSIQDHICKNYPRMNRLVTYTTRPMRRGETDGVDYHFISEDTFGDMIEQNTFAEYAQYRNWWYGTATKDLTDNTVAVLTPHGMRSLQKKFQNSNEISICPIYIYVPRRDRLIKLLERGDDIEEAYRRSLSDVGQFDGVADEVFKIISNDGYKTSVENLAANVIGVYMYFLKSKKGSLLF